MASSSKNKTSSDTVWQLTVDVGEGLGKYVIAIFDDEAKAVGFIQSLGMEGELIDYSNEDTNDLTYYCMEFTAGEAIKSGFLDMYKLYYANNVSMRYILCLEQVPLNKQLVHVVPIDS